MKALAAWTMRGPMQAAVLTASALLVGIALPPFAWLSAAMMALVMLSAGPAGALRVAVPALVISVAGGWLAIGSPYVPALTALASWLPVLLVAGVLRTTTRLDLALAAAAVVGWVIVLSVHAVAGDPAALWQGLLEGMIPAERMAPDFDTDPARVAELIGRVAPLMTGLVAASTVASCITALFLARWWQAALYNPGGFRGEFHQLRLGQAAAMVTAALMALSALTEAPLVFGLALVAGVVYLFQGLAVVHGLVAARGMHLGWLVGMYVLGVVLFLQMALALIIIGIVDAWVDLRRRAGQTSD